MKKLFYLKSYCSKTVLFFALAITVLFSAATASAHRVVVFAWVAGDTVFTESRFPDGRKITDGRVRVLDLNDSLLLEGKTDVNGEFSFKIPKKTALNIVLDAGMGHQGQWKLTEDEIASATGVSASGGGNETGENRPVMTDTEGKKDLTNTYSDSLPTTDAAVTGTRAVCLTEQQLAQLIENALDKKLTPVTRQLARMRKSGPSANEIFGGIGYIIGLMGVAAYFLAKKREQ